MGFLQHDFFCSPLSFSPSLALVDLRKKEEWVFYRTPRARVIHSRVLLPASSRSECRVDRQRERESELWGKLEGEHYSE